MVAKYWQNVNITETIKTLLCQYPSHQNSVFIMSFIKNERKPTEAALGHINPCDYNSKNRLGRPPRLFNQDYKITQRVTWNYFSLQNEHEEPTTAPQEAHPNKTLNKTLNTSYRLQRLFKQGANGHPHASQPDYPQVYLDNRKNNARGWDEEKKEWNLTAPGAVVP